MRPPRRKQPYVTDGGEVVWRFAPLPVPAEMSAFGKALVLVGVAGLASMGLVVAVGLLVLEDAQNRIDAAVDCLRLRYGVDR